jgi:hypothetical protein
LCNSSAHNPLTGREDFSATSFAENILGFEGVEGGEDGTHSQNKNVLYTVTLYSKYNRALNFQNFVRPRGTAFSKVLYIVTLYSVHYLSMY